MAINSFPLHEARLIALFTESIFYGVYLVSFAACMRVFLFNRNAKRSVNKTMFIVALAMGAVATLSLAFQLKHVMDAFLWYHGSGGPLGELWNISNWVNVMQTACTSVQILLGDFILIYRCYVVYDRRWLVIAFPLLVWITSLVTSSFLVAVTSNLKSSTTINEQHIVPWLTTSATLTLVQTVCSTSLLAYRIWTIDRRVSKIASRSISRRRIIRVVIESGAIYTFSVIIFLVLYLCGNNALYPVSACIDQIIGIVFNSIIVRAHQGRTVDQETTRTTPTTSLTLGTHSTLSSSQPLGLPRNVHLRSASVNNHAMQPLQGNVQCQVVRDTDAGSATFGDIKAGVAQDYDVFERLQEHGTTDKSCEESS